MFNENGREVTAIVLDYIDHGESDKIVTFYSSENGRITGIAKGARKSKKRFMNKLELFSALQLTVIPPRQGSLFFISQANLLTGFLAIRQNYHLYTTASVIREFTLLATKEHDTDNRLFQLLIWALQSLESNHPPLTVLTQFLLRMFGYAGYQPDLASCFHCAKDLTSGQRYHFDSIQGGLICSTCKNSSHPASIEISQGTIKMLHTAQRLPLEKLSRLSFTTANISEALTALNSYGQHLYQREIHSWRFLQQGMDLLAKTDLR